MKLAAFVAAVFACFGAQATLIRSAGEGGITAGEEYLDVVTQNHVYSYIDYWAVTNGGTVTTYGRDYGDFTIPDGCTLTVHLTNICNVVPIHPTINNIAEIAGGDGTYDFSLGNNPTSITWSNHNGSGDVGTLIYKSSTHCGSAPNFTGLIAQLDPVVSAARPLTTMCWSNSLASQSTDLTCPGLIYAPLWCGTNGVINQPTGTGKVYIDFSADNCVYTWTNGQPYLYMYEYNAGSLIRYGYYSVDTSIQTRPAVIAVSASWKLTFPYIYGSAATTLVNCPH